ncbi:glycosyltransferase family 2 protein [Actinomadura kijaniata]|uniref:glycosyltransferase family 2 protein n=1 Tax=Actinomadura kijaniata TaxID=46161 RepID=UPI00082BCBFF|nr:glycosyltransferase family 2 protein [Actinomadura kijaniata]
MISIVVISKDEPELDATLSGVAAEAARSAEPCEIVVVDASEGRLDHLAAAHPGVRWLRYDRPPGVRVSIPHQRNVGVRAADGDVVVFTDAGCLPAEGWLGELLAPLAKDGEDVVAGVATGPAGHAGLYDRDALRVPEYLEECPTINLAFRRSVFDAVGGFDESFEYGSDVDFSWRVTAAGYRIRSAPAARVVHDWGDRRRQARRSYAYGKARARLYLKHRSRLPRLPRTEPMVVAYPVYLLGLPVAVAAAAVAPPWSVLVLPGYLALLLVPAWRNRRNGAARVVVDHLVYGAGVLAETAGRFRR